MTTYASEPGTRLGGRYRLEDRIAAGAGWDAWKAIDETLARAVTVFTFAQGFPRTAEVITAARAASRLTDPRIAQVFDVEDAWQRPYIVMEWAAGETLDDMLSQGPLDPDRAARVVAEAASALASAHAAGVAHMCLSPGSVRWSPTGEVKVVGLGMDAALSGISAENPVLADLMGLGGLLYAGLTGCWPGPEYPSLPPAPIADGQPRSPRQVLAGVPAVLSDLACQAMQLRVRGVEPLSSPEELARALRAAVPPPPVPPAPVPPRRTEQRWQEDAARDFDYWPHGPGRGGEAPWDAQNGPGGQAARDDFGDQLADWPDEDYALTGSDRTGGRRPRRPGGHRDMAGAGRAPGSPGRRGGSALAAMPRRGLVVGGMGAVAVAVLAFALLPGGGRGPAAKSGGAASSPSASAHALTAVAASGFDPLTSPANDPGNENSDKAKYAIDGDATSSWQSQWYKGAQFGGLKAGSGLLLDFGKPVRASSVTINLGSDTGASFQLLVGTSDALSKANLDNMTSVASETNATGTMTITIAHPASGRYLVIWFTTLPAANQQAQGGPWYMAEVFEVTARGTA